MLDSRVLEALRSVAEELEAKAQEFDRRGRLEAAAICRANIALVQTWQARHEGEV